MPIAPGNLITLNWTNPGIKAPITINPGVTNVTDTSLELIGQGKPGWAVPLQENLLKILENSASTGEPPNATMGQLWFNTAVRKLSVCVDTDPVNVWEELTSTSDIIVAPGAPDPAAVGNLWFNPLTGELKVCLVATVELPAIPAPAIWGTLLTWQNVASTIPPAFPRTDGQLWYDLGTRTLFGWNDNTNVWDKLSSDTMAIMGSAGWNSVIAVVNKLLSTPTNTLENADPFTGFNSWGFNQNVPFSNISGAVSSANWLAFYDKFIQLCWLLGVTTTGLVRQDYHLPGNHNNEYGVVDMSYQWTLVNNKLNDLKDNRYNIAPTYLQRSDGDITYVGTAGAGIIFTAASPQPNGYSVEEDWVITATSATNFTVVGSVSGAAAAATLDVIYENAWIRFLIESGVNSFIAGDTFTIHVRPNLKTSYTTTWGVGGGSIILYTESAFQSVNHLRAFFNAGGKITLINSFDDTTTTRNTFWNVFLTAVGTISIDRENTKYSDVYTASNIGYYDLTNAWQTICELDARILPPSATRSMGYSAPFTASVATANVANVGNGTVTGISVIDQNPLTSNLETWTLTAVDDVIFTVIGSISGYQADATVGTPYTNSKVGFTINTGVTLFVPGDTFTFTTTGILNKLKLEAKMIVNNIKLKLTLTDTASTAPDEVTTTGANKGLVTNIVYIKANNEILNDPEIPWPLSLDGLSEGVDTLLTWAP